ncbi:MAG: N-acetylmuramic acid 6-phosphate etherase [Microscillaceae bacterium]|nr:N-acetylmuramic acid 6-phosphate etherase [Microscillaceae bacterium]MDW8460317.1 N-acetylmuramic acid 6-phosphate etherase [Cytophagales bacterium]
MTTESPSQYQDLEKQDVLSLLQGMNREDKTVAFAVEKALPQIEKLVKQLVSRMKQGGRLFYIGAGTSGRLGILDAAECPPTFGTPPEWVVGIIAGGDEAIRKAVEFAEDNTEQGWKDLQAYQIKPIDTVVGIAASGKTPYVCGALQQAKQYGCLTAAIVCNEGSLLTQIVDIPIEVIVGAEFLTGSTRLKAGTAQKMILNMISTTTMIQLGRVKGNKMVDMQLTNQKLIERGIRMIMSELHVSYQEAAEILEQTQSVRTALSYKKQD